MKTFASTLLLLLLVGSALGQGIVNFNNNVLPSPPDRLVRFIDGSPLVGTNFVAQLLYGNDPNSLTPHTTTARFRVATTTQPGTWSGGTRTLTGVGGIGTTICLQVRYWDSAFGATFDQARAAGGAWGESSIFPYSQTLSSPPAPTDTQMLNFQAGVICVPEPSCLLLLGVALPFLLRRRSSRA
jgi:hypothetical protein